MIIIYLLVVDDLLAPVFSYERVNSFFFFTFRTASRICDYIRPIQKTETFCSSTSSLLVPHPAISEL